LPAIKIKQTFRNKKGPDPDLFIYFSFISILKAIKFAFLVQKPVHLLLRLNKSWDRFKHRKNSNTAKQSTAKKKGGKSQEDNADDLPF